MAGTAPVKPVARAALSYSLAEIDEMCDRYRNWGRWGEDDQRGTLNFIDESCVIEAARLVKAGKVICCGLPYDKHGPQKGDFGRINPIHMMLADGGDVMIGAQDHIPGLRYADDAVYMPLQCGTQW
ncbi:MAG TPA: cyclase family protein, partial [Arthrobacter sp.]|nr:cyclase family protein [Arthrobacter sp.]